MKRHVSARLTAVDKSTVPPAALSNVGDASKVWTIRWRQGHVEPPVHTCRCPPVAIAGLLGAHRAPPDIEQRDRGTVGTARTAHVGRRGRERHRQTTRGRGRHRYRALRQRPGADGRERDGLGQLRHREARFTGLADRYTESPGCSARTVHLPASSSVIVVPSTVHTVGVVVVNVTGSPDDAVALTTTGDSVISFPVSDGKVIV